jgi:thiamine-monophosphate kinase
MQVRRDQPPPFAHRATFDRIPLGSGREFDLIRTIIGDVVAPAPGVVVGPGDDCAILDGGLAISLDTSIEDVHFRGDWLRPDEIGYRAVAAALSDLAAVAAQPIGILVALAVPAARATELAPELMRGARAAAAAHGAALLGGDLSGSPGPLMIDVAAIGRADEPILRRGAQVGDALWVTGTLGGAAAAAGAWLAGRTPDADARQAFARPAPRLREARWLAARGVLRAMIDLSDGLAGDAGHIAAANTLRAVVEAELVPVHPAAVRAGAGERARALALHGGEDYELLFAAPPGTVDGLVTVFVDEFAIPLTRIGVLAEGAGVALRHRDGTEAALAGGYDHFGRNDT